MLSRRRLSLRAALLLSAGLFFAVLAGSVAIQAQRIEGQHEIDRLESETVAAIELNRSLRSQVAVAESPARIMDEARQLEMVEPGTPVPLVAAGTPEPSADAPAPPTDPVPPTDATAPTGATETMTMGGPTEAEATR